MKYAVLIARILLGLAFVVFGANILFPFLPMPAQTPSDGTTWSMIMMAHKYMAFIGLCQIVGGLLVLVGRFVPLGLTILAPVLVNILLFHRDARRRQGRCAGHHPQHSGNFSALCLSTQLLQSVRRLARPCLRGPR